MLDSNYLYGDLTEYYEGLQRELAEHKLHCCERELEKLTDVAPGQRDAKRYAAIKKAQKFNQQLLDELDE